MSLSSWSRTWPSTRRVKPAAASSGPFNVGLASSRYQSQNSSQEKWYRTSQALANSNSSSSASVSAITAANLDSSQRSATLSAARSATVSGVLASASFKRANLA